MNNHQGRGGLPLPPTNQDPRASRAPGQAPGKQGLYDPANEHDACGVGFVADIKGRKSHQILAQAIQVLRNLDHRGACGCEVKLWDERLTSVAAQRALHEAGRNVQRSREVIDQVAAQMILQGWLDAQAMRG